MVVIPPPTKDPGANLRDTRRGQDIPADHVSLALSSTLHGVGEIQGRFDEFWKTKELHALARLSVCESLGDPTALEYNVLLFEF